MIENNSNTNFVPLILSIREAYAYMKCSRTHFWKLRKQGRVKPFHAGMQKFFQKEGLDILLNLETEVENG